jgi:exodeoxyribonuclease VII large subunit
LVRNQITNHQSVLSHLRDKINLLDPVNTLKRGYSITRLNGKALTDPHEAAPGALIESELAGGKIISTINN